MIIEAFAEYLHGSDPTLSAQSVLTRWLWERLTTPPETLADRILRAEIKIELSNREMPKMSARRFQLPGLTGYVFGAEAESGRRMLRSLYEYAHSYEQQRWSRWVHCVKASDFNRVYKED